MPRHIKIILITSLCLLVSKAVAQQVSGMVVDEKTQAPLPFVNIGVTGTRYGTSTNVDGKFTLQLPAGRSTLEFRYVGYESQSINVTSSPMVIRLREQATTLRELVVRSGANPAVRIIREAVAHREINDPENLPSFSYNSYNKLYGSLEENPTGPRLGRKLKPADSISFNRFIAGNHLFIAESYTRREFRKPNFSKEVVLGNQMSGIRDPFFSFLATDFQPFTFYKSYIELFGKSYLNPITPNSEQRYDFTLADAILRTADSLFVITFEPLPGKSFEGLKGQLYISSDGYALEHVLATPADDKVLIESHIQQKYEKVSGHWFPSQLNTELRFKQAGIQGHLLRYVSRSYITRVNFDAVTDKSFDVRNVTFDPEANHRSAEFWKDARIDSLGRREQHTYTYYDSLSQKLRGLNNMMGLMEGLMVGKLKAGKFYLPLDYLLKLNEYENVRFGLGIQTGERLSRIFQLDGYAGYGLRDKALKYGGGFQLNLQPERDMYLRASYRQDLSEPGSASFHSTPGIYRGNESFRMWLTSRMDSVLQKRLEFGFRPRRFSQLALYGMQENRRPTYGYHYVPQNEPGVDQRVFNITEIGLLARFAWRETYTQIGPNKIATEPASPHLQVRVSRAEQGWLDGAYGFSKIEFRFDYHFNIRGVGKTRFEIQSGKAWGTLPYPYLFNGKGSDESSSFKSMLYIPNYFQTMGLYEFASDQYAYLFIDHNFGRLTGTRSPYFRPELSLVQHIGYGSLQHPSDHIGLAVKSMDRGFFESGLMLNNLLRFKYVNILYYGIGAGVFYRYGPNALPVVSDNFAAKIQLTVSF
ncbi:MAG TPA: DUF5686 family protein [Cyclobacteriaceae bacterium]|nr:DUF5686 family protein [Cyclobacteriaceae bacterium]